MSEITIETIRTAGRARYPAGASFGPRHNRDFEFVWLESGSARWQVDDDEHRIAAGGVFLCRPGQRDVIRWDDERSTLHGYIHFDLGTDATALTWPACRHPGAEGILLPLLRHGLWLFGQASSRPGVVEQLRHCLQLALSAYRHACWQVADPRESLSDHPIIRRCLGAVERIWRGGILHPLSLSQLAAAAEVSPGHLTRLCKRELGTTPTRAILLLRLARAAEWLALGDEPVAAIADRCGFAAADHFSRRFKEIYQRSPRAYRRAIRSGASVPVNPLVDLRRQAQGKAE